MPDGQYSSIFPSNHFPDTGTSTIDLHSTDCSLINPPLRVDNHLSPPSNGVRRRVLYVVQT